MGIIHDKIKELSKDYTTLNILRFDEFLHTCESTEILEDFSSIIAEPSKGAQFAQQFTLTSALSKSDLTAMKTKLESMLLKAEVEGYTNFDHIASIESTLALVNSKLETVEESCIADLLIDSMYLQELAPVNEATSKDSKTLKAILSKDLPDEDKIKLANKFISSLKVRTAAMDTVVGVSNITTITSLILYSVVVVVPVTLITILLPAPVLLANALINGGGKIAAKRAYIRGFKSELKKIDAAMISAEHNEYLMIYKNNIIEAISILENSKEKVALESVLESAVSHESLPEKIKDLDMIMIENYYNFIFREDETVEESIEWFKNIVATYNVKSAIVQEAVNKDYNVDDRVINMREMQFGLRNAKNAEVRKKVAIRVLNNASTEREAKYIYKYVKTIAVDKRLGLSSLKDAGDLLRADAREDNKKFKDWAYSDEFKKIYEKKLASLSVKKESCSSCDEDDDDLFDDLDLCDDDELDLFDDDFDFDEDDDCDDNMLLTEGKGSDEARKKVNVAANKIRKNADKLKHKVKQSGQATKAALHQVDKTGKAMDDAATGAVNKAKNVYRNDVRDEIIETKTTVKFGRIIRKAILVGSLTLVNPAIGAIGAMTTLAMRKNVKAKEKRKILRELEEELEIVNEKIEDSRGDENKEKKYQLMRIRNKLQKDITRIQYGIKADDKGV